MTADAPTGEHRAGTQGTRPGASITVVMPAYNAVGFLPLVLAPLIEMEKAGEVLEILVVDDCSTDETPALAARLGAQVLRTPKNGGPGAARNLAAQHAAGEILWFVDSDVIAWPGGPEKIRAAMAEAGVVACFGSYDHEPAGQTWISRYKNLTHRYYHQEARREASTFWAGCGAVRKDAFLAAGGFDVKTYTKPSIEDIELGYRLRARGGRILLVPDLLGKHLKVWTVPNLMHTDIFRRAIPWSRLMIARNEMTDDLNTSTAERARALLAGALVASPLAALLVPGLAWLPLCLLAAAFAANWRFFTFLRDNAGLPIAIAGLLYHQVYYVYSAAAFVWCVLEARLPGRRIADPR
ncbi:MAG: glycosyltransferase family 2 protein [Alphaproteobacteria bacterium]|nr:glycosyltransferase family 2 protein [Alphaproteobacteria bacterium]